MAGPILREIVRKKLKSGEVVFKRGHRRVSQSAYRSQQWRLRGGKAGTARRAHFAESFGEWMRVEYGSPGGRANWAQIYTNYPGKLDDYVEEYRRGFA